MIRQTITVIVFILSVCSVAYPQSPDPFDRVIMISNFVSHAIKLPSPSSDKNIRAMGRVISVDVGPPYAVPHDEGIMLEARTYNFNGLQLFSQFVKGTNDNGLVTEAVVTSSKWKIEKGLNVGSPIAVVVKTLGEPTSKSERTYEYCGETSVDCAIFEISKNKVVKIKLTYYWD